MCDEIFVHMGGGKKKQKQKKQKKTYLGMQKSCRRFNFIPFWVMDAECFGENSGCVWYEMLWGL